MRHQAIAKFKAILRPVVKYRFLPERAKYLRTTILDRQEGNDRIARAIAEKTPFAVGKIGETELGGLRFFLRNRHSSAQARNWGRHSKRLFTNAGVFPATAAVFTRFCQAYGQSLHELDLLAVWFRTGEYRVRQTFAPSATLMAVSGLEPYFHSSPWSSALAGKRVLIVSPFTNTISAQFARRERIWPDHPDLLPAFELDTLRCPLSAALVDPVYPDWFAALDAMKAEMSRRTFDVAIIGAGAWGIPLAVHAKSLGRTGVHLGGATQILFGIRGDRWDHKPVFRPFFNDSWVRPSEADRPNKFREIENGCYW